MRRRSHPQLGSTNWPFVIALVLLLGFIYMWYDESDRNEKAVQAQKQAEQARDAAVATANQLADLARDISVKVGWNYKSVPTPNLGRAQGAINVTDLEALATALNPDGVTTPEGGGDPVPSVANVLKNEASLVFTRESRTHGQTTGEEKAFEFATLSAEFKKKLEEVRSKYSARPEKPVEPIDKDDLEEMADFRSKLQEYERWSTDFDAALKALTAMEGWKEYNEAIRAPGTWGDPKQASVSVNYYKWPAGGAPNLESLLDGIPAMVRGLKAENKANAEAQMQRIQGLVSDNENKEQAVTTLQGDLATEQQGRTTDVGNLQTQLQEAQAQRDQLGGEVNTLQQKLQEALDKSKDTETTLRRDLDAYKEANRLEKEKRDLVIRRDDPKGSILVANAALGTATIDRGTADKVYVGQKFRVSDLDKGGNRRYKGEVMVLRTLGRHSSQVRILKAWMPLYGGDRIHNPFYSRDEEIHVYIHGTLDKWPKQMARERLALLNVIVQDQIDGNTDYIVVSNSLAAPPVEAAGEDDDEEEEEGPAPGSSVYEQLQKRARDVGAQVVPERLFDEFLDF